MAHVQDEDCTLDPRNICTVCGVWHGDPCRECGGRGFHRKGCNIVHPEFGDVTKKFLHGIDRGA